MSKQICYTSLLQQVSGGFVELQKALNTVTCDEAHAVEMRNYWKIPDLAGQCRQYVKLVTIYCSFL